MTDDKKMLKTAVFMSAATILSKVFGLLREMLLASSYGTSVEAVAFETASSLPILIFDFILGGVISAAFIPVFNEILVKKDKNEALGFANTYVNLIVVITVIVAALGVIFSDQLVSFQAPDISAEAKELAGSLTKILFPMIVFTGLAFSFVGILQSFGEFNIPAIISLVSNGIMVAYFFTLNTTLGIYGLAVAMLFGWAMQAVIQIPKLRSFGYRYKPTFKFNIPYVRQAISAALPILVATWTQPLCLFINKRFASGLNGGRAITALGYSNRLYVIIVGVFSFVATNLLFPYLSKAQAAGEEEESKRLMLSSIKILIFIIAPITVGIFVLAEPFISVLYERGAFTADDVRLTASALKYMCLGMSFMAANEVLTKAFFARKKTLVPMISSIFSMVADFVLVYFFSDTFGLAGIALISGISVAINCLVNYFMLKKECGKLFAVHDFLDIAKCFVASVVMGVGVYFAKNALADMNVFILLALCILIGAAVYFLLCLILRTDEMSIVGKFFGGKKK